MKVKDILELENDPTRKMGTAIVVREGSWYRAYEWSAYLLYNLIEDEAMRLNPIRRACSLLGDGIVMVGFKESSAEKYLGEKRDLLSAEKDVAYIPLYDSYHASEEECDELLRKWKETIEVKDSKKGEKTVAEHYTYKDIVDEILGFNVAGATLIEDVMFISNLKEKVKNICS